jgi:hypothetical protein
MIVIKHSRTFRIEAVPVIHTWRPRPTQAALLATHRYRVLEILLRLIPAIRILLAGRVR